MGPSKDKRAGPNGETVLWFPRLPAGRVSYAARIGKDDKLIAIEQRLTEANVAKLQPGVSRESDVLDLLGPPDRVDKFPRQERDAWSYPARRHHAEAHHRATVEGRRGARDLLHRGSRERRAGRPRVRLLAAALSLLLAGCAGYDGRTLVPGQSTSAEVEKLMGPSKDQPQLASGETELWFPRLPAGRVSYAARIGKDDRLIAVEQRLTRENLQKLKPGVSREERRARPAWAALPRGSNSRAWSARPGPTRRRESKPQLIVVQFSGDHILREAYMFDDPDYIAAAELRLMRRLTAFPCCCSPAAPATTAAAWCPA